MKAAYIQIQESIIGDIKTKKLLKGDKVKSEHEFAKLFKVTRSTAKRALDNLTQQGVLSRVPGVGTFVATKETKSKNKISEEIKTICFLFPQEMELSRDSYHFKIFVGAESEAKRRDCRILFTTVSCSTEPEEIIKDIKERSGADSVIVSSPVSEEIYSAINKKGIPLVLYGDPRSSEHDVVLPDNTTGAYNMTKHLINLGHRNIGFYHLHGDSRFQERFEGYRRAMEESDCVDCKKLLWIDKSYEEIVELVKKMRVTAVLGANDSCAINIIQYLKDAGIRVPKDVSVVGFGNQCFPDILAPEITTVDFPKEDMGRLLVRMLLDRMANPHTPCLKILMPTKLLIKNSCKAI